MTGDYGNLTVGDLAIVLSFNVSDLSQVDWSMVRDYLMQNGLYTDDVADVISMFESGDYSLIFKGIDEVKQIVEKYPPETLLSDIYGNIGGGDDGSIIPTYDDKVVPTLNHELGRYETPLYDIRPDGTWSVPGIGDFDFTGTRDDLLKQIFDTGVEFLKDQAKEIAERRGVPQAVIDAVENIYDRVEKVKEVYETVKNFHTNLLDIFVDGVSGDGVTLEEIDRRLDAAVGNFRQDAKSFLEDRAMGFVEGVLHLEEVHSFRENYWAAGAEIIGGEKRDSILSNELDDIVRPGAGADVVYTQGGNDVVFLSKDSANDLVNGGDGLDKVFYLESYQSVEIKVMADRVAVSSGSEVDTLANVERIVFNDRSVAFDIDGNAGQAYRLYQAAFDREPDVTGLTFWIKGIDNQSQTLRSAAEFFVTSPEFQAMYGRNTSDEQVVDLLYRNVLNREADREGYNFWTEKMDAGMSRAEVLLQFSDSVENKVNVMPSVSSGIWYDYDVA